jgi:hypothetical protein
MGSNTDEGREPAVSVLEESRFLNDISTHVITVSSASVVVLATFAQQFRGKASPVWLAAAALMSLTLSILATVVAKFQLYLRLETHEYGRTLRELRGWLKGVLVVSLATFALGMGFLSAYAIAALD